MDAIHTAIACKRKIAFRYFRYGPDRKKVLRGGGGEYLVSPYALTWGEDNYYLIGHYPKYGITNFRVDRMDRPRLLEEPVLPSRQANGGKELDLPEKEAAGGGELDLSQYSIHTFGMYNGPLRQLDIRFDDRLADVVLDRFGDSAFLAPGDDGTFTANSAQTIAGLILDGICAAFDEQN